MNPPRATPPFLLPDLLAKWEARRAELARLDAHVSANALLTEILVDLNRLAAEPERLLTPTQAAQLTGYHHESIARMVRDGKVNNYGRKHSPRVKLSELPTKPKAPTLDDRRQIAAEVIARGRDIARDAVASRLGR